MALSVKQVRRAVGVSAVVLLLVVGGFFGLARLKGLHFHLDLPGRLGADIAQTANGFTYSQSSQGHTIFTIQASKLIEYKANQAELHDVTITLYGAPGSGRSDKIYGSDFTYDRQQGIARAKGEVRIDFASPEARPAGPGSAPTAPKAPDPGSEIHVTTSGLTFNQGTGEAVTDQRVDFALTRATGSAIGANYNAKTGVLVLDHQVALTAKNADGASDSVVHAEHAQLLRDAHQAYLIRADVTNSGKHTTADQATVKFRPDGSAEQIDARGHVHLTDEDGSEVHSESALIDLDPQSQPVAAHLGGGLTYTANQNGESMQGTAITGTLSFASAPAPRGKAHIVPAAHQVPGAAAGSASPPTAQVLHHAQFRDAVSFVLQRNTYNGEAGGSTTRELRASQLDVDFAPGANGNAEAQKALAVGGAGITLHEIPPRAPARVTTISGNQLLATLAGGRELRLLDGTGNTKITDSIYQGTTSSSKGDTLHLIFAPVDQKAGRKAGAPPASSSEPSGAASQIDTAIQTGHVVIYQTPAPDPKNPNTAADPLQATANQAEYHAADQVTHLTGDPHLRNNSLAMTADKVDYHRDSGDASAFGDVKATYIQQNAQKGPTLGGDGPVHVVADHGQLDHASQLSLFYGTAAVPARMWQGANAVAAPVLELSRDDQTLDAHGAPGQRGAVVHATLGSKSDSPAILARNAPSVMAGQVKPSAAAATTARVAPASGASDKQSPPSRLTSVTLHYSDKDRRADMRGSVVAEQPAGVIHADEAQVFLTPSVPGKPSAVDHMVATSHVIITQTGRRGTGEKLVYTAADGRYVLTGTPQQPPRVMDIEKGTTTGAALIFRDAGDSVKVSNQGASASRTVTDTHTNR